EGRHVLPENDLLARPLGLVRAEPLHERGQVNFVNDQSRCELAQVHDDATLIGSVVAELLFVSADDGAQVPILRQIARTQVLSREIITNVNHSVYPPSDWIELQCDES